MKVLKRFTVRITMPECIHMSEYTDEHQTTTDLDTLMFIWDPFYDAKQTLSGTAKAIAG